MVQALTDAAIVYGAQRYFDGLHTRDTWRFRDKYRIEDDRLLFFELMHYTILYDKLILDTSSVEDEISNELKIFIDRINGSLGRRWIDFKNAGESACVEAGASKHYFCGLLKYALEKEPNAVERFRSVPVPWAYHEDRHYDRQYFQSKFKQFSIDEKILPFAIFVWRALTYGAIAMNMVKDNNEEFAYVAAPGRLYAMKHLLGRNEIRKYGGLPRELVSELRWGMPNFPSGGFDFTQLDSIPFFATSPVSNHLFDLDPREALLRVRDASYSEAAVRMRHNWQTILFNASNYASVGMVNIQILQDTSAGGDINQTMRIKATPLEEENQSAGALV